MALPAFIAPVIMYSLLGWATVNTIPPIATGMRRYSYSIVPNELMPIAECVEARWREVITPEQYEYEVRRQGFDDQRQDWVYKLSENLLGIMELISLHRRGVLSQELLFSEAEKIKWSGFNVTSLLKVTEAIPSAQDIIAFAVREVYSPEIAEAFGQFDGLDDVFDKAKADIIAIGMTKETFGKFWAAHWMLPSVGQGFEMVHRGVIPAVSSGSEPLGLDRLMTALDIMPAWRDKLTAISYSPFTRVDVRRMNKIGVLSDEELVRAYMDLGYDEFKAGKMAEFTILYNEDPPEEEETETDKRKIYEKDLTKSDILYGYENNILEEGLARSSLAMLKYDPTEIEYYIARVNQKKERAETDSYLRYYHDAYIRGVMTHNELVDKLNELNLTGDRSTYLFKMWDLEKMARTSRPTKSELMHFLRKGTIDKDVWHGEMKGLGYPEKYIAWFLKAR